VRLAIAVAAAFAIAGVVGLLLAGGGDDERPSANVTLASAQTAVAAQGLASTLAAYALQAQTIDSVDELPAHGVQLRRLEQALTAGGGSQAVEQGAERLQARAVAAREAATSDASVAGLQAFGREAQKVAARLQSLLTILAAARSAAAYDRALARVVDELERGNPAPEGPTVGADDPVPDG
jgi:hypothetical protein